MATVPRRARPFVDSVLRKGDAVKVRVELYGGPADGATLDVGMQLGAAPKAQPQYDWKRARVPAFRSGAYVPEFDGRWGTVLRWRPNA